MEPQLSQSHVTLVLSSAYTECAGPPTAPIDNSQSASTAPNGAPPEESGREVRGADGTGGDGRGGECCGVQKNP